MSEKVKMSPEVQAYYDDLKSRELTRSGVSIHPSFSKLTLAYRVVCRQRYSREAAKMRKQFLKELSVQEALTSRALDGVRIHREFSNPIMLPPRASEIITLSKEEVYLLKNIMETKY